MMPHLPSSRSFVIVVLAGVAYVALPRRLLADDTTAPAPAVAAPSNQSKSEEPANLGHYSIAGYEYFAEEPIFQKVGDKDLLGNTLRKKIYVLPRLVVMPNGIVILGKDGQDKTASLASVLCHSVTGAVVTAGQQSNYEKGSCTCGSSDKSRCRCLNVAEPEATYSGGVRFRIDSGSISRVHKYVIASHYLNRPIDSSIVALSADSESTLPFVNEKYVGEAAVMDKLDAVDGFTACLQFHQVAPRSLSVVVKCDGRELSRVDFPASSYISSNSVMCLEFRGLTESIARRIAMGLFSIQADMEIDLARQQLARSDINLRKLNRFFAEEFSKRDTQVTQSSRGLLFWKKTEAAVNSLVSRDSRMQGNAVTGESYAIDLRDADPALRERAFSFVFDRQTGGPSLLDEVISKHQRAAADPSAGEAERKAHQEYAAYLRTLKSGDGDPAREKSALDALSALASSMSSKSDSDGSGSDGAGGSVAGAAASGAAASGNPYLAMGLFLLNGIIWKDSSMGDRFVASTLQQATWTDEQSRSFTAAIQSQRRAGFTIVQAEFPVVQRFLEYANTKGADRDKSARELLEGFYDEVAKDTLPCVK